MRWMTDIRLCSGYSGLKEKETLKFQARAGVCVAMIYNHKSCFKRKCEFSVKMKRIENCVYIIFVEYVVIVHYVPI